MASNLPSFFYMFNIYSKLFLNMNINKIINEQINSLILEKSRNLTNKQKSAINKETDDLAREVYGDEYGEPDEDVANKYKLDGYRKDADIKGGPFSVGNQKLSPDTLIINFTSAFGCPSAKDCPITQAACYAVAGENRLTDTRKKNIKVQKLLTKCFGQKKLDRFFKIAKLYIDLLKKSKNPIKWVRFNEAGDFPNQEVLNYAVEFAKQVEKDGVKCMAYTARGNLNFSEASTVMAINASTNKVLDSFDDSAVKRNFFGVEDKHFDYKFIEDEYIAQKKLNRNPKAEEVPNSIIHKLEVNGTTDDITRPILQYGKWGNGNDEQGYYYICPCSFWKDRKNQIEFPYCEQHLDTPPYDIQHLRKVYGKDNKVVKDLEKQLNKIESPCGISCAVCHDRNGGVVKGTNEVLKNYVVLTGIHGSTGSKFNANYARMKREGNQNAIWSKNNVNGRWTNPGGVGKYGQAPQLDK